MRYHFFLHYGWFFQNLGKEDVRTFMHTTVSCLCGRKKRMDKIIHPHFKTWETFTSSKKSFLSIIACWFLKKDARLTFSWLLSKQKDKTVTKTPLLQLQNILSVLEYQNRTLKFIIVIIWFYFEAFYLCRPCKMYIHKIAMFPLEYMYVYFIVKNKTNFDPQK